MKWLILLPINIIVNLFAIFLSPLWCLFANSEGSFPIWLKWAATWDYPADGDPPFIEQHAPFKGLQTNWFKKYINRIAWMIRNPAYGFDKWISFIPDKECKITVKGTRSLGGDLKENGWVFATAENSNGKKAWQLYITYHWNSTHCTKINLGWKLWLSPDPCTYVFSPMGVWKVIT